MPVVGRLAAVFGLVLCLTASVALDRPAAVAAAGPQGYPTTGIDVSNHQETVPWSQVADSGARFVYVKASEGVTFTDRLFPSHYRQAKQAGLYAGAYHYALPDRSPGAVQADHLLDVAGDLTGVAPGTGDAAEPVADDGHTLPPMLDLEWPGKGSTSPSPCYGMAAEDLVTWVREFTDRIRERTGRLAVIYTNTRWWNECTDGDASFGHHPLFIANYSGTATPLPPGWDRWTLWQYADAGELPGDQDVFQGGPQQLADLAAARSSAPSPSPSPSSTLARRPQRGTGTAASRAATDRGLPQRR